MEGALVYRLRMQLMLSLNLFVDLTFPFKNVSFADRFYEPPCVITTASHQYEPLKPHSIPPSENAITEWTEVGIDCLFSRTNSVSRRGEGWGSSPPHFGGGVRPSLFAVSPEAFSAISDMI